MLYGAPQRSPDKSNRWNSLLFRIWVNGIGQEVLVMIRAEKAWIAILLHQQEDVILSRIKCMPVIKECSDR